MIKIAELDAGDTVVSDNLIFYIIAHDKEKREITYYDNFLGATEDNPVVWSYQEHVFFLSTPAQLIKAAPE